jgi:PAS domain-containing protein
MKATSPRQKKGKGTPGRRIHKRLDLATDPQESRNQPQNTERANTDYRTLVEKSRVGVYVIQKGRFTFVNSVISDILGYESPEHLIGKPFWELIHPDDRKRVNLSMSGENHQLSLT